MAGTRARSQLVKRLSSVVLVLGLVLTACAQGSDPVSTARLTKASGVRFDDIGIDEVRGDVSVMVRQTTGLGANLIRDTESSDNKVVSPWGAMVALQMLRVGARGNTAAQLESAIGAPGRDVHAALIGQLDRFDSDPGAVDADNPPTPPVFHQATGLFIDESVSVESGYLDILGESFDTGVYPTDFSAADTEKAIADWLAVNTGGEISETPTDFSPETVISLLSTVYLAAAWQQPFPATATSPAEFTDSNGKVSDVNMMKQTVSAGFLRGAGWTGLQLPYSDGFALQVFLPSEGNNVNGFLDPQRLTTAGTDLRSVPQSPVSVGLPRWDVTTHLDLKVALEKLGVRDLFTDAADLTGISPGLLVTAAAQDSTVTVGEKGTVAASATQIDAGVTAMPPAGQIPVFVADRPFVYQIIDTATGLPLFLGTIIQPGRV